MAAGDVFRVTMANVGLGSTYENVIGVRTIAASDPSQAQWQTFADDFMTQWRAGQQPVFSWNTWRAVQVFGSGVTYGPEDCKRHGGRLYTGNFTAPTAGSGSVSDSLPPQCAMVITLSSAFIGRRKRGRMFGFGFAENDQAAGQWTGTVITAQTARTTTWFNKYKETGTDANFQIGIWSEREATGCIYDPIIKDHKKVDDGHPDQAFTPVSGFQLRSIVYSQRRRTLGVGR